MPKVSVILSSYNHGSYIAEAIQSVLNQTFVDFELLIFDDGSSDNSRDVIRSFKDERIKLLLSEINRGPIVAAREALGEAAGEYIAVHHSDDVWEPTKLAKQVEFLDKHHDYAACFTLVKFIDESGNVFEPEEGSFYRTVFQQTNRTRAEWLRQLFFYGNCLCHPSAMIRRQLYGQYGLMETDGLWQLPDYFMWVKILLNKPIYIIQDALTRFRLRKNEQNQHSGERPEVSVRSQFELYQVLRLYKNINSAKFMQDVFPETNAYLSDRGGDIMFALAKVAQTVESPPYRMLSLELLYNVINDSERAKKAELIYNYTVRDFIKDTGQQDVFNISSFMSFLHIKVYVGSNNNRQMKAEDSAVYVTGSGNFFVRFNIKDVPSEADTIYFDFVDNRYKKICVGFIELGDKKLSVCPVNRIAQDDDYDVFVSLTPQYVIQKGHIEDAEIKLSGKVDVTNILSPNEVLNYEREQHKREREQHKRETDQKDKILNSTCQELEREKTLLQSTKNKLEQEENLLRSTQHELEQKNNSLLSIGQELDNTKSVLSEREEELRAIKSSRGWRVLQGIWFLRDKIIPLGSKRRLLLKVCYRVIRSPRLAWEKFSINNLKKFLFYMKNDDAASIEGRLNLHLPPANMAGTQLSVDLIDQTSTKKLSDYSPIDFTKFGEVTVSIIIPVYNQFEFTYNCLKSIHDKTKDIAYEIIIADDCSTDYTKDMDTLFTNITIIHNQHNLGFLRNCNNATLKANGRYILFLNNDTQVQENWLQPLVKLLDENKDMGMVGSKLVYPNGSLQEAGGIYWQDGSAWNYGHADVAEEPDYNYVKDVDYISGAAILIRRELWQQIGGFDEYFLPAYCEDADLAFAVRAAGYRVVYQPQSVVVHFEGVSNGRDLNKGIKKYQVDNQKKFYQKWQNVLLSEHFPNGENVFWARDRSRDKKTILVVDHYVPHYDTDAGGRCTFEYLKLFVAMSMHVIFVGDNYAAHQPYTDELRQMGVNVLAGSGWTMKKFCKWLDSYCQYIDYVYLNRPHISIKYIDIFRKQTNAKIFYFGHDLHFIRERRQAEIENRPELLESANKWEKIERELFTKSDVVHVVGSYEQGVLQEMFPGKPIRNIPLYLYNDEDLKKQEKISLAGRDTMIFVGGFNHRPNQDAIFWFMENVYPLIEAEFPNLIFYIVGSRPDERVKALAGEKIIVTGYVSDDELERIYSRARINVIPLRYGAGVKGKVVETLAYGVPAVTTKIGAEGLPNVEKCLDIAEEPKDYAARVSRYLNDDAYWMEQSDKCRRYVKDHFSVDQAREILLQDMSS